MVPGMVWSLLAVRALATSLRWALLRRPPTPRNGEGSWGVGPGFVRTSILDGTGRVPGKEKLQMSIRIEVGQQHAPKGGLFCGYLGMWDVVYFSALAVVGEDVCKSTSRIYRAHFILPCPLTRFP